MSEENFDDALTPWSTLTYVSAARVRPLGHAVDARLAIPGSKSLSNRALILAAMAEGTTMLSGLLRSDDTYWCADALRRLGAEIAVDGMSATVRGVGRRRPNPKGAIHVGSSGTLARFLPPFLAAGETGEWRVTASRQMTGRPVAPLFEALRQGGAAIAFEGDAGCFPAVFTGDSFDGGRLRMSGRVSSQFISGMLLGAVQSRHGLELTVEGGIVQSAFVGMTLAAMRHFGAAVEADTGLEHFTVAPTGYRARDMVVDADASTATYFAALTAVTGGRVSLTNLTPDTLQPDYGFMALLERLGCSVTSSAAGTTVASGGIRAGALRGGFTADMRPLSDAVPTLAAIAPFADSPITIAGVEHIRHHECDRIDAMCRSLRAVGVSVEEHRDGLTITPAHPRFAVLDTFEDHRIAMSLAVLGAAAAGVELRNPACVSKTCPTFFDLFGDVGVETMMVAG